jgi:hypothetical protein
VRIPVGDDQHHPERNLATGALIEYVFTYRDEFEEFKKRRAKAKSPAKEAPAEKQKGSGQ